MAALASLVALSALTAAPAWTPTGSLAIPRQMHTASLMGDGSVLVVGGSIGWGQESSATELVERFDPGTGTFQPAAPLHMARAWHTATLLQDGRLLVAFGGPVNGGMAVQESEIFDPATGAWTLLAPRQARIGHTATLLANGRVLIVGGLIARALPNEEFDPESNGWVERPGPRSPRLFHAAVRLQDGRVLIAGGINGVGPGVVGTAEIYDPATATWSDAGTMLGARNAPKAELLPDGRVLVVGGGETEMPAAEIYDPATGTWSPAPGLKESLCYHQMTALSGSGAITTGGITCGANETWSGAMLHDGSGWQPMPPLLESRNSHTVTALSDGALLVVGGRNWVSDQVHGLLPTAEIYR
jgi:hypothetical protein